MDTVQCLITTWYWYSVLVLFEKSLGHGRGATGKQLGCVIRKINLYVPLHICVKFLCLSSYDIGYIFMSGLTTSDAAFCRGCDFIVCISLTFVTTMNQSTRVGSRVGFENDRILTVVKVPLWRIETEQSAISDESSNPLVAGQPRPPLAGGTPPSSTGHSSPPTWTPAARMFAQPLD
ncbi:hypothetical protein BaRGS_00008673 [Batillaria attramentaria]|uniref:Uncharacterized protein n=1 Tax=Batillaria attramentaria TaxID=370345 RepID=A0ABD0LKQ8_9CAEN